MSTLWMIILAVVGLVAISSMKHHFQFRLKRTLLILAAFFIFLVIASAYFDLSGIFSEKNVFAKTGAAIISDLKDAISKDSLIKKDTVDSIKDNLMKETSEATKGVISLEPLTSVNKNKN